MDLEQLRALPPADQQIYLLGRIAAETTSMEAALRFLHAALRGETSVDGFLDAPKMFRTTARECRESAAGRDDLEDRTRTAVKSVLDAASAVYDQRNRYVHDLLRSALFDGTWELAYLTRQPEGEPEFQPTSFDEMVALVLELVAVKWRLRGCALYVLQRGWASKAFGRVEGQWDGSATSER